jgi:hypothetical protein
VTGPRVLVCGGRDFTDQPRVWSVLDHYHAESGGFGCIVHGAARGADTLAGAWASARGVFELPFPADWDLHGYSAGPIRNARMLHEGRPDVVIAFPGGKGTANMIEQARAPNYRIPVLEIPA